jgi:hypothetical protein
MSALGQKRTFRCQRAMSALPPKAEIKRLSAHALVSVIPKVYDSPPPGSVGVAKEIVSLRSRLSAKVKQTVPLEQWVDCVSFAPSGVTAMNIITGWQFTEVLLNDEAGEPVPDSLSPCTTAST